MSASGAQADRADYLADATRTYLTGLEESRVAFAFADSAFSVLQREIQRTTDPVARQRALSELTVASTSTAQIMARATKHGDYITDLLDLRTPATGWQTAAFPAHSKREDSLLRVIIEPIRAAARASASVAPETYWRRVRDELQAYFNVSLRDLQSLVGIAYPTLVNLGKRKPHPSTARAVLQLHTLASHVLRSRGDGAGREWLASVGRRTLEREGFDVFKTVVVGEPERVTLFGGISLGEEPEATAAVAPPEILVRGERF